MSRIVTSPPRNSARADGLHAGGWWHEDAADGRVVCDLCPRACRLNAGDRGFCFVRQNVAGEMVLTTFGRSTGFCIDPIEKKPLNHFYPGTSVLSFGTAGCNLGCKFCQNWDISKSKDIDRLSQQATPGAIAEAARSLGCRSVAFTYNDPVIWAEYAIETARACRALGVKTVAVTAGYITAEARAPFYEFMDAANVDLKAFSEEFYQHVTLSHLQPVLDTLAWLKNESNVWFEITNLIIPQENDSIDEIRRMSAWVLAHCGDEVPVHFSAFHPDFRMRDRPNTPPETLCLAHDAARAEGLKYVYVGNIHDVARQSTYCPHCGQLVIERDWYALGKYQLRGDHCGHCGGAIAGRFDDRPGTWGRRRQPIDIAGFARPAEPEVVTILPARSSMQPPTEGAGKPTLPRPRPAPFELSPEQKASILSAAAGFVAGALLGRTLPLPDPTLAGTAGFPVAGAFVTLKRRGQLRACCGTTGGASPLLKALQHAAYRTARDDVRLPPISLTELAELDLSVNLLFGAARIEANGRDRVAAVEVGRHGLTIQDNGHSGLLLPGVAVENGWDAEAFLRHVCRKAGLATTAWEHAASLATFETLEFGGPINTQALGIMGDELAVPRLAPELLQQVAAHARSNILAMLQGMTPSYYIPGLADGNVAGLALHLHVPGRDEPQHLFQLSLRPGVPFQATLFGLCEAAAQTLGRSGPLPKSLRVGLTILADPAMHGNVAEPDLRGFEPSRRALLLLDQGKSSWVHAPAASPDELLATVVGDAGVLNPSHATLFSLEAQSTEPAVVFRLAPKAVSQVVGTRPAAVAGKFYPADPAELSRLVDRLFAASPRRAEPWPAAMVPHAGLSYSGRVAASVLHRLEIPDLVIVIGPKHTRQGVDWAVSPHEAWSIPGATLAADPALARALADAIPGLKLDAAAHRQEHAIEVELPFLARLNPGARVVGLAIGGGDWEHCRTFAHGLADVISRLPTRPLLLISSDMNHFANDEETRRLDEIALSALARLDPAHLLETVSEHNISMCGVLPAVIVMEALRRLGGLQACERVAYATSAEVSGDLSRVVGYAGVLLR